MESLFCGPKVEIQGQLVNHDGVTNTVNLVSTFWVPIATLSGHVELLSTICAWFCQGTSSFMGNLKRNVPVRVNAAFLVTFDNCKKIQCESTLLRHLHPVSPLYSTLWLHCGLSYTNLYMKSVHQ